MKDSYSFDRDRAGLEESYAKHRDVYIRIFERCGLEAWPVEADVGMMGGYGGEEFVAPSPNGEAELVRCCNCDYAANVEVGRSTPRAPEFPPRLDAPQEVETPGIDDDRGPGRVPRGRPGGDGEGDADRRRRQGRARARPRRPPAARAEDAERARRAVPARPAGRDPGDVRGRPRARSGRSAPTCASSPTSRCATASSSAARTAPAGTCAGSRPAATITAEFADLREVVGRRHLRRLRQRRAQHRAGDRGRPHLQAGDALLGAAERELPRRGRQGAPDRDGLLRHRPGPRLGRGGRAAPRREGDRLAGQPGAVPRAHGRDRRPRRPAVRARAARSRPSSSATGSPCSSTTVRPAPARASPTPS